MRSCIIVAIVAIAAAGDVGPRARGESVTFTFQGLSDGSNFNGQATTVDDGYWFLTAQPIARVIGPGDASYSGATGVEFGADWSLEHTNAAIAATPVLLESITVNFALVDPDAPPVTVNGTATIATSPAASWAWDLTTPGPYPQDLGAAAGDTLTLTETGFFQATAITINWEPIPAGGGGGGTVPEPCTFTLAWVAVAATLLVRLARTTTRPRERRAGSSLGCRAATSPRHERYKGSVQHGNPPR